MIPKKGWLLLLFLSIYSANSLISKAEHTFSISGSWKRKIGSSPSIVSVPLNFSSSISVTANIAIGQNQMVTLLVDTTLPVIILKRSTLVNLNGLAQNNPSSSTAASPSFVTIGGIAQTVSSYVASLSVNGALAPNCSISVVNDEANLLYDGVLGLGLDPTFASFLDDLGYDGSSKYFSVFLASHSVSFSASELTLGGFNAKRFTGPLYWYNVPSNTIGWSFSISDMSIYTPPGSSRLSLKTSGITFGKIDTGSVYIILDTNTATTINQQIGAIFNGSSYVIPCSLKPLGPNVIFLLSNGSIPIHVLSANYIVEIGNNTCISAFKGGAEYGQTISFGIPFLQAAYTVYDYSESPHRIAFAQAVLNSAMSRQISFFLSFAIFLLI